MPRGTLYWVYTTAALIADPVIVFWGVSLIKNGDAVYGAVLVLVGAYWFAGAIISILNRRGHAEGLMTLYGLGLFFVLAAWIGIGAGFEFVGGRPVGIGIGIVGLVFTGLSLRYGVRILIHWLRAPHG